MLHDELRRAREAAGLSQAELAARAGIPRNQVVRAEKGHNITLDTLRKLAVQLPIDELTLVDTLHLTVKPVPEPDDLYFGSVEIVYQLAQVLSAALKHAGKAQRALKDSRRGESPEVAAVRGAPVDPVLLFRRLERLLQGLGVETEEPTTAASTLDKLA